MKFTLEHSQLNLFNAIIDYYNNHLTQYLSPNIYINKYCVSVYLPDQPTFYCMRYDLFDYLRDIGIKCKIDGKYNRLTFKVKNKEGRTYMKLFKILELNLKMKKMQRNTTNTYDSIMCTIYPEYYDY